MHALVILMMLSTHVILSCISEAVSFAETLVKASRSMPVLYSGSEDTLSSLLQIKDGAESQKVMHTWLHSLAMYPHKFMKPESVK